MYIFPYLLRVIERFVQCLGQKVMWLSIWVPFCHSVRMANSLIEGQDRIGSDRITGRLHYTHHSQFLTVSPLTVPQTLDPFCAVLCAHIMQHTSHDSNIT
jgi:hypothetical protein